MNFKFSHDKDIFIWDGDNVRVIFSDPSFQPHNEYGYVKSIKNILYNYYNIDIFKKSDSSKKWKLVTSKRAYDFPKIIPFIEDLDVLLHKDIKSLEGLVTVSKEKDYIMYKANLQSADFAYDDFYNIQKTVVEENNEIVSERYSLYIGCAIDIQGSSTTEGIWIDNLNVKDVEELYNCVTSFMNYSIKKYNQRMKKYINKLLHSYKIVGNKLYQMNGEKVEQVICIGDNYDIVYIKGSLNNNDYSSEEYYNHTITDIKENSICIESKYIKADKSIEIKKYEVLKDVILEMFYNNMSEEKLHYGIEEIVKDWVSILNEDEKEEFRNKSIKELYKKWCNAIIARTWMCRNEHNFPKIIKDKDHNKNVHAIVKEVIKEVKKLL